MTTCDVLPESSRAWALRWLIENLAAWPRSLNDPAITRGEDGDPACSEDFWWSEAWPDEPDTEIVLCWEKGDSITRLEWSDARRQALSRPEQWPDDARILIQTNKGWWVFGTFADATTTPTGGWEGIGEGHWLMWHQVQGRADLAGWDWRESLVHREDGKVEEHANNEESTMDVNPNTMTEGTLPPESHWPEFAKIAVQGMDGVWVFGTFEDAEPNPESGGWNSIGEGWWYPGPRIHDTPPQGDDWMHAICRRSGEWHDEEAKEAHFPDEAGMGINEVTPEEEEAFRAAEERAKRQCYPMSADAPIGDMDALEDYLAEMMPQDPGRHYRKELRVALSQADIAQGFVAVKLDPYRICDLYRTGGGPREQLVKKGLRGEEKGQTERELVADLRAILDRWEEMLNESEEVFI